MKNFPKKFIIYLLLECNFNSESENIGLLPHVPWNPFLEISLISFAELSLTIPVDLSSIKSQETKPKTLLLFPPEINSFFII